MDYFESQPSFWLVSDRHAGNLRQVTALAQAMDLAAARHVHLTPHWVARACAPHRWWGAASSLGAPFKQALDQPPPELVIGCGRQAALATRLLRERGSKAVQILDPRIDPSHWDIVIVPEHDRLRGANVITLLGSLNPVDDAWLEQARTQFNALATLPAPRTTVLLGGTSRHVRVDPASVAPLLAQVDALVRNEGGSLLLTGSRRTDPALRTWLRQRYAHNRQSIWLDASDGTNPYPGLLAWADRIVCSPDSVNMISEACATHAPVYVHAPDQVHGRIGQFLHALHERGRIKPVDADMPPFTATALRETARVASAVRLRLQSL